MRAVYSRWDGGQQVRLDPDRIFERLAEHLSRTDDLSEALDRLLREGLSGDEAPEVLGIDELLRRIREAERDLKTRYNLDHSLDRHEERLRDLLEAEEEALAGERNARRREELGKLPRQVDAALDALRDQELVSEEANAERERLESEGDELRRVASFVRRNSPGFVGPESLDFYGTLDLMERLERLRDLQNDLTSRNLAGIDPEDVAELLGSDAAEAIEPLRGLIAALAESEHLVEKGGRYVLSPRAARKLGRIALREIYAEMMFDSGGRHSTERRGASEPDTTRTKRYEFGDSGGLDVGATVRSALRRGAGTPIRMAPEDLRVYESRAATRASTVLLLDMSWSMSWEGRFAAAKKVALAMECLMRSRYPTDYFGIVGFYTRAQEIRLQELPEVTWNMGDPFTNLQDGLRLGCRLLSRHPARTQQLIVITDGQPTAYFADGRLYCEWPMSVGGLSSRATVETLKEVERVTRRGVVINTFMLDDSPELGAFVQKMTSINKGRAFYTTPEKLGRFLMVDYVGRRTKVL